MKCNMSSWGSHRSPSWSLSIDFPPKNLKHTLTLFSKSISSFPRGTFSLSVSHLYLALDGIYHSIKATFQNRSTRQQCLVIQEGPDLMGLSPSQAPPFQGTWPKSTTEDAYIDYNSGEAATRFSWWALLGSLTTTRGILVSLFSST